MSKRILIRNARLIDPASGYDGPGGVLIEGEVILDAGAHMREAAGAEIIEAAGMALMPGLIDMRVVTGEPGAEHKETFKSAGRAAAAGGVTTMIVMPDTDPVIDDQSLVDFVLRRAPARTKTRILPAAALTRGLKGEAMTEMGLLQEAGAVMFTNGDKPVIDSLVMRRALSYSTAFGALVAHRPEDPYLAQGGAMHEGELAGRLGLPGIPAAAETIMAERDLALAQLTGARLMLDLLSCAQTLRPLERAKQEGAAVSASVSVHHVALNQSEIGDYRTFAKLAPPLRAEEDRAALASAVTSGLIDVIVSGHDPRPAEDKRLPFSEAATGAAALETLLPGALSLHFSYGLPLLAIVRAMTVRPAELLGLPQGRLRKGAPADLILVDLDAEFAFDAEKLLSKSRNSPFDGRTLRGIARRTIVAGETIHMAH
ncbi:MAG: dihydroorotase [Hyphomonadaceae bacterium]